MSNTLSNSMQELMKFAKAEENEVTIEEFNLDELPEYDAPSIKNIRKRTNTTQNELSKDLGVSVRTVEAWESGRSRPSGSSRKLLQLIGHKSGKKFLLTNN